MTAALRTFAVLALLAACGPPPPVSLDGQWPDKARDFDTATKAWTREADLRDDIAHEKDRILHVYATFKSPEWRLAHVNLVTRTRKLPHAERARLIEEHRAKSQEQYEVELLVSTYDRRANDLQKNLKSIWRVVLVDDQGNEVKPSLIQRDRRPPSEIRSEYPFMSDFHIAYVATFPRAIELLRPDARQFSLKMGSSRGAVELVWKP